MIALYHSGTTTQSAGHNVALNQVINQSVNQAQDVCMNAKNSYQIPTCIIYAKQSMKLIKFIKSASPAPIRTSNLTIYLNRFEQGTAHGLRNQISPGSKFTVEGFKELKSRSEQQQKNAWSDFSRNLQTPAASRFVSNADSGSQMPRGKQIKKRSNSSSSGSVSSGGSGSGGGVTCGQYGGLHMTSQCRGVQGLCHNCGQPGHFSRVCSAGGQSVSQSHQGSAGGFS
ncbi:hypothetical protein F511_16817 [Dorcoceras hygrometricum]|uniref:CCHC-type domain-containing protein n=1 Tax=Dorcoceras hygrometricum TaxID=472368 RepID=A0A2Z7CP90_9LAMI|nr:hypothetical protein F511_16817 [Dorcoceras hygrometricum]